MKPAQEGINERFRETIAKMKFKDTSLTNIKLAAELGISPNYLSSILKGNSGKNASIELVSSLCNKYPEANYSYIIGTQQKENSIPISELLPIKETGPTEKVPYIRATAFASFVEATDLNDYPEREYMELPVNLLVNTKRSQIVFDIYGDSMYPTLKSGSQVVGIEVPYQDIKYISSGIYAVVYGHQFVIKRVKDNDLLTDGTLTLHSDNTAIAGKVVIPQDRIRAVWKVHKILNQDVE